MTKFSREWYKANGSMKRGDFKIKKIFRTLKIGEKKQHRCDGFKFNAILNKVNECWVEMDNGEVVPFDRISGVSIEKRDWYRILTNIFVFGGVVFLWGLTWYLLWNYFPDDKKGNDGSGVGVFGDMFGSINALFSGLALGGIILTIYLQKKELTLQRKELKDTREEFEKQNETLSLQRFENTFFQMVNLHHEIADKLKSKNENVQDKKNDNDLAILAQELIDTMHKHCYTQMRIEFADIGLISPEKMWKALNVGYHEFYFKHNNEQKLSHYYRNLYHIFKFIYFSDQLSDERKKFYGTLVRAQLSPDELLLIYYNCMYNKGLGNPKFMYLVQFFDLDQNFNSDRINEFIWHESIFKYLKENTDKSCLFEKEPTPVKPDFQKLENPVL